MADVTKANIIKIIFSILFLFNIIEPLISFISLLSSNRLYTLSYI